MRHRGKFKLLNYVICVLSITILHGCSTPLWQTASIAPEPYIEEPKQEIYKVQPGDELEFKFLYNPELNERITIYPDGRISLQLIGEVQVGNLTLEEIKDKLKNLYDPKISRPEFTIFIRSFASYRVFVGGEVHRPQSIPLIGNMDILHAIFEAGGIKNTAQIDSVIVITRDDQKRPVGKLYNLQAFLNGTEGGSNCYLNPYDIVYVPKSKVAQVNEFVDQYILKMLPGSVGASFVGQYNFNREF